jgi:hemolysin D
VETFRFPKYSIPEGGLLIMSNDAVEQEGSGLVFLACEAAQQSRIRVDRVDTSLTPGLAFTEEMKPGWHRVIDYLLMPQFWYPDEAVLVI